MQRQKTYPFRPSTMMISIRDCHKTLLTGSWIYKIGSWIYKLVRVYIAVDKRYISLFVDVCIHSWNYSVVWSIINSIPSPLVHSIPWSLDPLTVSLVPWSIFLESLQVMTQARHAPQPGTSHVELHPHWPCQELGMHGAARAWSRNDTTRWKHLAHDTPKLLNYEILRTEYEK